MRKSATATKRAGQIADEAERFYDRPQGDRPLLFMPSGAFNAIPAQNNIGYKYEDEELAFPKVNPGLRPTGSRVLVQMRAALAASSGGLLIDSETRKTEHDNTQVGKVVAIGSLAFRNRESMTEWPEGSWCKVGDYVRIPKYQGDRFNRHYVRTQTTYDDMKKVEEKVSDIVTFVMVRDLDVAAIYDTPEEALTERAYL